jgi:double-strand break repair protein MRE11
MPNLSESLVGTYRILQPGSSVACSLSAGESSAHPKHMVHFEVKERKFRSKPIKFRNVRQFIYEDISLKDIPTLNPTDPKAEERVKEELRRKVLQMLQEARSAVSEPADTKYKIIDPNKVLVRLRVDHEGFPALNHQRFGSQFVGEVANPSDILLLVKRKREGQRGTGDAHRTAQNELKQLLDEGIEEEIHRIKIEDLVGEALANSKNSLSLLVEEEMAQVDSSMIYAL